MAFAILQGSRTATIPGTDPTDEVVPIHWEDDTPRHRANVMNMLMRIEGALDAEKLHRSLWVLLERPGWRKLGGRLRYQVSASVCPLLRKTATPREHTAANASKPDGTIACHIPSQFSDKRPPVAFHHEPHDVPLAEHGLASRLPTARGDEPLFFHDADEFVALTGRDGDAARNEDYLAGGVDRPALGIHVVTFTDATLVTVRCSHLLVDLVGLRSFLDAWILVLGGRADAVPPVHGNHQTPMEVLGAGAAAPPYKDAGRLLGPWGLVGLGLRVLWHRAWRWREADEERRIVCVPAAYLGGLRAEALGALARGGPGPGGGGAFLSDGDVLCAWWARLVTPHLASRWWWRQRRQTVALINVVELRALLAARGLLPAGAALLGNAHAFVSAFCAARDVAGGPLGRVAAAVRAALATRATPHQLEAFMRLKRSVPYERFVFGDAGMLMLVFTNFAKARLYELDFSAALVAPESDPDPQDPRRPRRLGTVSLFYNHPLEPKQTFLFKALTITGKDQDGNYWLNASLNKDTWAKIDRDLGTAIRRKNK